MKKAIASLLLIVIFLSGCSSLPEGISFCYPRTDYAYGASDGVFASELREVPGHEGDLYYLISLYLRGPLDDSLQNPFPGGCVLESVSTEDTTLVIRLSSAFTTLSDLDLTVACTCLAKTALPLCSAEDVRIESVGAEKNVSFTISPEDILLSDDSTSTP